MLKNVRYQRSEGGEVDLCLRKDSISDGPGLCHRCDHPIPVGSEVSVLRSYGGGYYRMHKECADKGCMEE